MCRPCLRSLLLCLALYLSSLTNANGDPATVSITEFMAANSRTLLDEDGDNPDWIELFNSGPVTTSMDGWFLTEDIMNAGAVKLLEHDGQDADSPP